MISMATLNTNAARNQVQHLLCENCIFGGQDTYFGVAEEVE
jgi:hypothetical protein